MMTQDTNEAPAIPILDLAALETDKAAFLADLRHALGDVGFAYVENAPGFDAASQQKLFALAHEFYDQPIEKLRAAEENRAFFGWQPPKRAELTQEFHFSYPDLPSFPPDDPSIPIWKRALYGPNVWPDIPGFREAFETHLQNCDRLNRTLHRAVAESLGFPADALEPYCFYPDGSHKGYASVRILHYTPLAVASEERRAALAKATDGAPLSLNEHIDYNPLLTLLLQSAPGLEVLSRSGVWVPAPPIPGCVVINVGQVLSDLTRGHFVATMHRVNATTATQPRISIPCFLGPDPNLALTPLPGLAPRALSDTAQSAFAKSTNTSNRARLWSTADTPKRLLFQRRTNHPHTMLKHWPELVKEIDAEIGEVRIGD